MPPIHGSRSYGPDNPAEKRQVQVTTTITPTIARGAETPEQQTLTPVRTLTNGGNALTASPIQTLAPGTAPAGTVPEQVPTPSRAASQPPAAVPPPSSAAPRPAAPSQSGNANDDDDSSIFPANLSWWQILGIAVACVAVFSLIVFIVTKRRSSQRSAKKKEKEARAEERRAAQEEAARLREETLPHRLMGMGMGMGAMGGMGGMGTVPMVWNQGGDRSRRGGGGRRGKGRRYDDNDSDDSWDSSGSESYDDMSDGGTIRKRRRRGPRRRKDRRNKSRDRRGRKNDRYSEDDEPPYSAASSFYARPRKERERDAKERTERQADTPVFSVRSEKKSPPKSGSSLPMGLGPSPPSTRTPQSGGSGSISRKPSKRKTFRDSVFSTYDSMKRAAVRHKYMDGKVRMQKQLEEEEAIERQRQAKIKEANEQLRREKEREQRSMQQIANLFGPGRQQPPAQVPAPAAVPAAALAQSQIPMPQPKPLVKTQPTFPFSRPSARQPSRDTEVPIPTPRQHRTSSTASAYNSALPEKQHKKPPERSSSELPYAYDGVASVVSSAAGVPVKAARPTKPKPTMHRQDSDPPLKSAMRTPGERKPKRTLTINDKTSTIKPKTQDRSPDSSYSAVGNFLTDWLSKPPDQDRGTTFESPSTAKSVELSIPHPKDRPVIKRGGLAPAPPPRARTKSSSSRSTVSDSTRSDHSTDPLVKKNNGDVMGQPQGQAFGTTQPGRKWADRLRDRR